MSDDHDPLIDACLDEILGGQTPPDLTPRIIQAWSMLPPAVPVDPPVAPPVQASANGGGTPVQVSAAGRAATASSRTRRGRRLSVSIVAAASVIAIGLGIGFVFRPHEPADANPSEIAGHVPPPAERAQPAAVPTQPRPNAIAQSPATPVPPADVPEVITPNFVTDAPFAIANQNAPFELVAPPRAAPLDDDAVVSAIDLAIRAAWQEHEVSPAAPASDEEFADRVYRQILGRAPGADELKVLIASRAKDKRGQLVDRLLTAEENVVEFARHWSDLWTDGLVGPAGTAAANPASRDGLQQYLRRSIQQAKPMDQVASELLTATGAGEIGAPQYNGATNFLLAHHDGRATRTTAQVARALLGKRIQCAQCHDHPSDSTLAQNRFWELNTFLRQLDVQRAGPDTPAVLVSRDFHGDGGGDGSEAEVFYETVSGEVKVAYPGLPGVTGIPRSGLVEEFDRRAGLAQYVATSPDFRRSVVNRVWSHVFGYGFTSPVDDLGPHNPPSHPGLLNELADQFAAHDHDLRSLIRWMVLSEAFQLGGDTAGDLADATGAGRQRWFNRRYVPLATEPSVQDSLLAMVKAVAEGKDELGIGTTANIKPSFPSPGRLSSPDSGISPLTIAARTVGQDVNFVPPMIERILAASMSNEQKLEHLFLVTLQRSPNRRERGYVGEIAGDFAAADRAAWLRIWWALERSQE